MRNMRKTQQAILTLSLVFMAAGTTHGQDNAAKVKSIVERAIKAKCGSHSIEKTNHMIVEDKGVYHGQGAALPYQGRYVSNFTKRQYRMEIKGFFLSVIDKDTSWTTTMGQPPQDAEGDALTAAKEEVLVALAMSMIPFKDPKSGFKVALAEEETVAGDVCDGLKVSHDGMPDVTLFVSRKSGLVRKTSYMTRLAEQGYKKVKDETVYDDFKKFDGIQCATKVVVTRDGQKFVESSFSKISFPDALDASEFQRP